jgi:exosortase/archaeosortase family protein
MEKDLKKGFSIIIRYLILILIAIPNLYLFYLIFTPLTTNLTYIILNIFSDVNIYNSFIEIDNSIFIQIIDACVAGSAYYLLLILNLSTPNIHIKKRLLMILSSFSLFLLLNLSRIILSVSTLMNFPSYFNFVHYSFWYISSIFFVIGIWFLNVKLYKIKEIPIYSDFKFLVGQFKW